MKRPLLWCAGAYALGEVLALPGRGLWTITLLLIAGAVVCRRGKKGGKNGRAVWFFLSCFFLFGILRLNQAGDSPEVRELDRRLAEEESLTAVFSGKVAHMERRNEGGRESFRLLLSGCRVRPETERDGENGPGGAKAKEEELKETKSFPVKGVLLFLDELPEGVREGRDVVVRGKLSEMEEARNPGQFDSRSHYRSQGISYLAKGKECLDVSGGTDYLRCALRRLRQYFSDNLFQTAGEKTGGMLCAMVLGEKWEADGELVSLYTESGMGHLLAISGLHISLAGMGVYRLLRKKLKCSYALAACGCAAMSFCYYLLTGEGTSAGRAFFMLTVYGVGQTLGRQYDLASAAALSALVMLVRRPLLLFQSGFLLSFGSVLALGLLCPLLSEAGLPKGFAPFFPGFAIQLLTLPVQAFFFYQIPVYSLLLNLAVLPLFTVVALLGIAGALLGGVWPGFLSMVLFPARWILRLYEFLGEQSLRLPGALWRTGRPKTWQMLLYGGFLLLLCRWLGKMAAERRGEGPKRESSQKKEPREKGGLWRRIRRGMRRGLPGLFVFLGMVFCLTPVRYRGMELVFLDVGQGDGCFLRTPEGVTFLVDGGSSDQRSVGEYCLEPFLDAQAVRQVDYVLVSHGDADHVNGIGELVEKGRVGSLILPRGREGSEGLSGLREQAGRTGVPVFFMGRGERFAAGETVLTCLWPEDSGESGGGDMEENEASMVLWLSWRELDVLFTGDLEGVGETAVTACLEAHRRESGALVDILKVPHHGSGGTSSAGFLEAVSPGYGVISCGKNNRYGHPAEETLERLSAAGCRIFRTDQCGAVTVRSDGKRMEIVGYRDAG